MNSLFSIFLIFITLLTGCTKTQKDVFIAISPAEAKIKAGSTITLVFITRNTEIILPDKVSGKYSRINNTIQWTLPDTPGTYEFTIKASMDLNKTATAVITAINADFPEKVMRVGVFGGSIASLPESETAKTIWERGLNISVTSEGASGKGFSSRTNPYSIPVQIANSPMYDIYILWASTNDMGTNSPIGVIGIDDPETQSGGMLNSIELIRQININALILLFTSLPRFDNEELLNMLHEYVLGQIVFCEEYQIPYLDQYSKSLFNWENYTEFYMPDNIHLTDAGYAYIAYRQLDFIREQLLRSIE